MIDQEYVQIAIEKWHHMSNDDKFKLVDEWMASGSLLAYIYEELHFTDDEGVEHEENMDYEDIEEIFLYRHWLPRTIKQLKDEQ